MFNKDKNAGFTLIEIVIVLAISTAMILMVFGSLNSTQKRTIFKNSIEQATTEFEKIKNESNSTLNTRTNPGTDKNKVVYGKAVVFTDGSADYIVHTLSATNQDTLDNVQIESSITRTISSEVEFRGDFPQRCMVFTRHPSDGRLQTFMFTNCTTGGLQNEAAYNSFVNLVGNFKLVDVDANLEATIKVDSATSTIMRSFDN
jgi:prepilin-type N-terminal cleavage/methylation domain-containing protein